MLQDHFPGNGFVYAPYLGVFEQGMSFIGRKAACAGDAPRLDELRRCRRSQEGFHIRRSQRIHRPVDTAAKRKQAAGGITEGNGKGRSFEDPSGRCGNALVQSLEPFLPLNQKSGGGSKTLLLRSPPPASARLAFQ